MPIDCPADCSKERASAGLVSAGRADNMKKARSAKLFQIAWKIAA